MNESSKTELFCDKYRLSKKLGQGAFGSVYRAEQEIYGVPLRTVALKMFEADISNTIHAREIFNDAVILLRLLEQCDDLDLKALFVQIFDIGSFETKEEGKGLVKKGYMAMELMEKDLRSIIGQPGASNTRKVSVKETLSYMTPVIDAIAYMHSQNPPILHRDLKPDNILFKYRNGVQIKVADFGLAIRTFESTSPIMAVGALNYLDLESFIIGTASTESDVYALGIIFYELLTGRCPFELNFTNLNMNDPLSKKIMTNQIRRVVEKPVPPPSDFNIELKKNLWLEMLIMKCLTPYRSDRIRDAAELKRLFKNRTAGLTGRTLQDKYRGFVEAGNLAAASGSPHWQEAEKAYSDALKIMPKPCNAVVRLARLYVEMGEMGKAEGLLMGRLKNNMECPHVNRELSSIWDKRNKEIMKKRYLDRAQSMPVCKFIFV